MATATQPHSIQLLHSSANSHMPHGLGLLTTVASLPPKYRSRYLNIKTKCEIPLDLSVKPTSPQIANDVPMATTFTEVYTERTQSPTVAAATSEPALASASSVAGNTECAVAEQVMAEHIVEEIVELPECDTAAMPVQFVAHEEIVISTAKVIATLPAPVQQPVPSPAKRKYSEAVAESSADGYVNPTKMAKTSTHPILKRDATPSKPIKPADSAPRTGKAATPHSKPSRNKATRKLKFDEETSSPVSGTIIRPLEDITDGTQQYSNGDIDPKYNIVEITEETKAELAAIKNVIGDYICKLCRIKFDDAFGLARHRCACIVLLEYRCPECGKQFNCPANLASHRRWHKPKSNAIATAAAAANGAVAKKENRNTTNQHQQQQQQQQQQQMNVPAQITVRLAEELAFACVECGKKFKRQAYLRKHQQTHAKNKENHSTLPCTKVQQSRQAIIISSTAAVATTTITGTFQTAPYAVHNNNNNNNNNENHNSNNNNENDCNKKYAHTSSTSSSASSSSSSASSMHSYVDEGVYVSSTANGYDYDADSMSDCSSTSSSTVGYGRLQIVEHGITEEESIAAAALTNLRNCASVIQHTTAMAH